MNRRQSQRVRFTGAYPQQQAIVRRIETVRKREEERGGPATNSGPRPADFPIGSLESRAAARAVAITRAAQRAKAPTVYRAPRFRPGWQPGDDEPFEICDYDIGLPVGRETR